MDDQLQTSHKAAAPAHMYIALRPCGRVSAMCVDEPNEKDLITEFVSRCLRRGDAIVRMHANEIVPEPICAGCRGKECQQ